MNLLQQLMLAQPKHQAPRAMPQNWIKAVQRAGEATTANAIERYRDVMQGKGWMQQSQIENALGYATTVSTKFLKKLHQKLQLVEKRNRDGAVKYARKHGYEYRWKNGA